MPWQTHSFTSQFYPNVSFAQNLTPPQTTPITHNLLKGFTLPTSNTTTNGSFSNLITQTSANANTIVQAPLMFVRGGYVTPGNDRLYFAGGYGTYWSSVGYNSNYADYLDFSSGYVVPSSNFLSRYNGYSVRCVALGG